MRKLYFIRHGLSELGSQGLYAGRTETPLTEEGRLQARQAGQAAKTLNLDVITSSPLQRALETARIISSELGLPPDSILISKLLIERDVGELDRTPYISGPKNYAEFFGAETDEQLLLRAQKALKWLDSLSADNLLVVGHAGFGRALRSLVSKDFDMSHPDYLQNAEIHQFL